MSTVASTLELVVPLMEHPSEVFLAQLEEDAVKLILQRGQLVIASCIACLAAIVNNLTHNYKLIRDVFQKYHSKFVNASTTILSNVGFLLVVDYKLTIVIMLF